MNSRARISPDLVIIAACARPYALAAARAGYRVAAFDMFNDVETRRSCLYSEQVDFFNGSFDADDLWRKLGGLDLSGAAILYGSGFEKQPSLLDKISRHYSLSGNTAETVDCIKSTDRFFSMLDSLGVAYPETRMEAPDHPGGWLTKEAGGSGGTHVRFAGGKRHDYFQRYIEGMPVSLLFLADGKHMEVIGHNEQWLAPAPGMPFRYGGAVGNADIPLPAKDEMADAASRIVDKTGLRGLNSMDFMLTSSGVLALEVNPRLSASFDLYDNPDLMERHLQACRGRLIASGEHLPSSKAHLVYYPSRDVDVMENMTWPEWAVDLPAPGTRCPQDSPLCSLQSKGGNPAEAKALVFARAHELDAQLADMTTRPGKP